jgi:hypothetical protein
MLWSVPAGLFVSEKMTSLDVFDIYFAIVNDLCQYLLLISIYLSQINDIYFCGVLKFAPGKGYLIYTTVHVYMYTQMEMERALISSPMSNSTGFSFALKLRVHSFQMGSPTCNVTRAQVGPMRKGGRDTDAQRANTGLGPQTRSGAIGDWPHQMATQPQKAAGPIRRGPFPANRSKHSPTGFS